MKDLAGYNLNEAAEFLATLAEFDRKTARVTGGCVGGR